MSIDEDFEKLICVFPKLIEPILQNHKCKDLLVEVVMDLGRRPEARFSTHVEYLSSKLITWQDIDYSVRRLSNFADDNRAGIDNTLHRISCIRNRQGLIIGLTCRVGRSIYGTINIIRDLLESKKSILILGQPGVGKTTIIREIACVLANEMERRVVIIDTSNEIAGDSDVPHLGIGRARRMQVQQTDLQHQVMIEAVENHMPQAIIIDEIGTQLEAFAAQTIAERGVQLIGTAHGNVLVNLVKNPILSDLVGGIQYVTLSDEEARRRGTQKSILERKGLPTFQLAIELNDRLTWTIHENIEKSVDIILQNLEPNLQVRKFNREENLDIYLVNSPFDSFFGIKLIRPWQKQFKQCPISLPNNQIYASFFRIYCYRIPSVLLEDCFLSFPFKFFVTTNLNLATVVLYFVLPFSDIRNIPFKVNNDSKNIIFLKITTLNRFHIKLALRKLFFINK